MNNQSPTELWVGTDEKSFQTDLRSLHRKRGKMSEAPTVGIYSTYVNCLLNFVPVRLH